MFAEIIQPSHDDYKARRARLGLDQKPKPLTKATLAIAAPEPLPEPAPVEIKSEGYVPINMLAPPSWKFLLAYCCLKHKVSQKAVLSGRRNTAIINCRYEAIALVHTHQKRSMPEIGKFFNRDHTCILHALRKVGAIPMPVDSPVDHKSRPSKTFVAAPAATTRKSYYPNLKRKPSGRTALQQAVKRGYEAGISALEIAEAYNTSAKCIHVLAHQMGLQHPNYKRQLWSPK